jgi:hypothetical protein
MRKPPTVAPDPEDAEREDDTGIGGAIKVIGKMEQP